MTMQTNVLIKERIRDFYCAINFPNEILRRILRHMVTTSAAHVGVLRLLFPESVRFNALLAELVLPRIYVSPSVVAYMEGSLDDIPVGQLREWSLTKLYRYVGKNSGLATAIRDLFGYFKIWLFGKIVVCAVGLGWLNLHDFHPSGGWESKQKSSCKPNLYHGFKDQGLCKSS